MAFHIIRYARKDLSYVIQTLPCLDRVLQQQADVGCRSHFFGVAAGIRTFQEVLGGPDGYLLSHFKLIDAVVNGRHGSVQSAGHPGIGASRYMFFGFDEAAHRAFVVSGILVYPSQIILRLEPVVRTAVPGIISDGRPYDAVGGEVDIVFVESLGVELCKHSAADVRSGIRYRPL